MACRAVHFALNREQVLALKAIAEQDRVAHVQTAIEEDLWSSDPACGQETDLAWDAIHRALTDGALGWSNGEYPLNHVILAGELLYTGGDYILSLKSPEQVRDIAKALAGVTKARLRDGYDRIDPVSYGDPLTDADFNDVWHWFTQLTGFYQRSADAGHAVLFTVSQ